MTNAETNDKTAAVAAQGAHVVPEKAATKKGATRKNGSPKGQKAAKGAKAKPAVPKKGDKAGKKAAKPERKATASRAESKGAKILNMIGRAKGATLAEIMKATEWQAHSVRGFISTAGKKHGVNIESTKNEAGDRVYRSSK
jgi:DNA replication initiation complex subunit (GINS family)